MWEIDELVRAWLFPVRAGGAAAGLRRKRFGPLGVFDEGRGGEREREVNQANEGGREFGTRGRRLPNLILLGLSPHVTCFATVMMGRWKMLNP